MSHFWLICEKDSIVFIELHPTYINYLILMSTTPSKLTQIHISQPQYSTIYCTNPAPIRWNNFPRKKEKRAETRAKSKSSRCAFVLAAKPPCIDPATPTQTPDPPPWMTPSLPQKFPDPLHRRVPFLLSPLHGFAADSVSLDPNSIDRGRRRDPSLSLSLSRLSPEFSTWMIDGARRNSERERHNKAVSRLSALSDPRWWTR